MSPNARSPFNGMIRSAGNRSRALGPMPAPSPTPIPNIGQEPTPMAQPPTPMPGPMAAPPPAAAPRVQPSTFTMHPPGANPDPQQYNYEPQADGSWRVYPPGVNAPGHTYQASLPRAASTGDYIRMSRAFQQLTQAPQQQAPAPQPMPQPPV